MVGNAAYQVIAADLLDNHVLSLANISHNPDAVSQLLYQKAPPLLLSFDLCFCDITLKLDAH